MKNLSVAKAEIFVQELSVLNVIKIKICIIINSIMAVGQIVLATF